MIEHVLFPTDFSDASERALPHALEISRRFQADLTLLHVRTPFEDDPYEDVSQFFNQGKYEAFVEQRLAELSGGSPQPERVQTATARNISAASGILEFVDERAVDIVVMGTHGRSAISRFFLGSVAERVVRHAHCPVLTVAPGKDGYRNRPVYKKVLAAFDFSDNSKDAVLRGTRFVEAYEAQVEILYVVEQVIMPPLDKIWKVSVREEIPKVVDAARETLTEILGKEGLEHLTLHVEVGDADGKAENEIVAFSRQNEVDLIVMGTHGLSGIDHALIGSTTERVVRAAPCPVLTFHRPAE